MCVHKHNLLTPYNVICIYAPVTFGVLSHQCPTCLVQRLKRANAVELPVARSSENAQQPLGYTEAEGKAPCHFRHASVQIITNPPSFISPVPGNESLAWKQKQGTEGSSPKGEESDTSEHCV